MISIKTVKNTRSKPLESYGGGDKMLRFLLQDLEAIRINLNKHLVKDRNFRRKLAKNRREEEYAYWYGYYKTTLENISEDLNALIHTYKELLPYEK